MRIYEGEAQQSGLIFGIVTIGLSPHGGKNFISKRANFEKPTYDIARTHSTDDGADSYTNDMAQEEERGEYSYGNHGAVHRHLNSAETPFECAAECQAEPLCRQRH